MQDQRADVKMYSDYKSPYAYLAFDPGFELEQKYNVRVHWRPFQLRIKGKGSQARASFGIHEPRRIQKACTRGPKSVRSQAPNVSSSPKTFRSHHR